jgi:hypothetical protein
MFIRPDGTYPSSQLYLPLFFTKPKENYLFKEKTKITCVLLIFFPEVLKYFPWIGDTGIEKTKENIQRRIYYKGNIFLGREDYWKTKGAFLEGTLHLDFLK